MGEVHFIDTTLRDGQQSLWALGMKTGSMLAVAEQMDRAGFESLEFFSSNMIKKYVREQKQDPWEWVREGTKRFGRTRLRLHGGIHGSGAFAKLPAAVMKLFVERIVAYGITLTRTSTSWNDFRDFKKELEELRSLGMQTIVNLIYSVSPRHTDEYYAERARQAAAIRPYRICLKDVGGLLTPERARTLIPVVLENAGEVPVEFHGHCNNGLGPVCYLEAVKLGVKTVHTAVPPLANAFSQPSIFNIAKNLRALRYMPVIHEQELKPVEEYFTAVARRDELPIGKPLAYDHTQYLHQIPGGMISNLRHQLRLMGMENKLEAILDEAARVRAEFGHPIMVTPLSQFVGSQAAINIIVGARYKEVTDQVIQYALGLWGEEAPSLMDPDVKDKILSRSRAKEWQGWDAPEPSLNEVRCRFGGPSVSDDELLLRVYAGEEAVNALHEKGTPRQWLNGTLPLVHLIEELSRKRNCHHIFIRKKGFSLSLERRRRRSSHVG
jgi:oxaloacetate decarboxylase (Na+ extruding) subunit alpha